MKSHTFFTIIALHGFTGLGSGLLGQEVPAPGPPKIPTPTAQASAAPKHRSADEIWAEIEPLFNGPQKQAQGNTDAESIFKAYLSSVERLSGEFISGHPGDARRWRISLLLVDLNRGRELFLLSPKTPEQVEGVLKQIMLAPEASADVKADASFRYVTKADADDAEFIKRFEAHKKAYPDHQQNQALEFAANVKKSKKDLKKKPLELKFTAVDGREIDLATLRGKVVLIDFWASWSKPCLAKIPTLKKIYDKHHSKGFEIIGISLDKKKDVLESSIKANELPWPQHFSTEAKGNPIALQWDIQSIPAVWLVDKKGILVDTAAHRTMEAAVDKLMAP